MLLLVDTYGNNVGLVEENVRCHKGGVGEQTCVYVLRVLLTLILELCHSGKLAEHGIAIQHPAQLCVCGNVGLHEECILFFIKTARVS